MLMMAIVVIAVVEMVVEVISSTTLFNFMVSLAFKLDIPRHRVMSDVS